MLKHSQTSASHSKNDPHDRGPIRRIQTTLTTNADEQILSTSEYVGGHQQLTQAKTTLELVDPAGK